MGESKRKRNLALAAQEAMPVDTLGGRMLVRWDEGAQATPNGQLVFFTEFLAATRVFENWVEQCPLAYISPNASSKHNVLGRLLLAVLAGHKRYAHITALRGDAVAEQALGMYTVISEDSMRRALMRIDEEASRQVQYERRKQAVRLHQRGMAIMDIAAALSMGHVTVRAAIKAAASGGVKALSPKPTDRPVGSQRRLTAEQELHIQRHICKNRPEQLKLEFALWSRAAVMRLVKQEFGIDLPIRTMGEYLKRWGFTPQKPITRRMSSAPRR